METGEELDVLPGSIKIGWSDESPCPIDIQHSYKFECDINPPFSNQKAKDLFLESSSWRKANELADELNELIEEYHAPGTPRRERRAIKRDFVRIFQIFRKHCQKHQIDFKFLRPTR